MRCPRIVSLRAPLAGLCDDRRRSAPARRMAGVRENEGALVERRRESIRPRLGNVAGDGAWRRPTIEVEPLSHSSCCTAKSNAVSCLFTVLISAIMRGHVERVVCSRDLRHGRLRDRRVDNAADAAAAALAGPCQRLSRPRTLRARGHLVDRPLKPSPRTLSNKQ